MRAYERMLKYVKIWTTSDENSETVPSTERQKDLGAKLAEEMRAMGIADAGMDELGYVYGTIPAAAGYEEKPALAFIAHMDTSPDCSGEQVRPQILPDYDGKDVPLGDSGNVLSVREFSHLKKLAGRTLITSDGHTLLGADDKAGIAEILTAAEALIAGGEPHGKICICFTPDEEIGRGAEHVDLKKLGARFGYTLDGSAEGEIQYENFNAAAACFTVHGISTHPGSAKGILVNAQTLAMEIHGMLPESERPETTEGYEGFYHLQSMSGNVSEATLKYIVRDFDSENFEKRQGYLREVAARMNEKYGDGTVEVQITESYRNMKEKVEPCRHLIDYAAEATREAGAEPDISPIRGGTDGATLSFMGLPCPNLGTGGHAFHGVHEHITAEAMDQVVEIILGIAARYAQYQE